MKQGAPGDENKTPLQREGSILHSGQRGRPRGTTKRDDERRQRIDIRLSPETLGLIQDGLERLADSSAIANKTDFIEEAIRHYHSALAQQPRKSSDLMVRDQGQTILEIDAQEAAFLAAWSVVYQQVAGANFRQQHEQNMSSTQFMVLRLIEEAQEREPCTISWLSQKMNLNPATVVRTVDSLEKRGLVSRRRSVQDRRQVFVEFTEEGRATLETSHQHFRGRFSKLFRAMSAESRVALIKGLQDFVSAGQQEEV